jgi:hypothetical protein
MPYKTFINGRIIQYIFINVLIKSLAIPCFINNYN